MHEYVQWTTVRPAHCRVTTLMLFQVCAPVAVITYFRCVSHQCTATHMRNDASKLSLVLVARTALG